MLADMVKGKRDYDAELATEAASNLSAAVGLGQSTLWPEGSDDQTEGNAETRALPEIWTTYPAVADKGQELGNAVAKLTPVAGDGIDAAFGLLVGRVQDHCYARRRCCTTP